MQTQPDGRAGKGKTQGLAGYLPALEALGKPGLTHIGQGQCGRGVFQNRKVARQRNGFLVHLRDIEHALRGKCLAGEQ